MNFIKHIKLRTFLIFFILSLTFIPITIFTVFSFEQVKNTIQKNYNHNYVISVFSEIRSDFSLVLSQANNIALQLNSSDELIRILNSDSSEIDRITDINELLSYYGDNQTSFIFMDYITPNNTLIHIKSSADFPTFTNTEFLNNLKRSKFTLFDFPIEIEEKTYCVLGKQLYNYQKGVALGTLLLYIDQNALGSIYENSDFDTFFVSLNNRILFHTNNAYAGSVLYIPESDSQKESLFSSTGMYSYYEDEFYHESLVNHLQFSALLSNEKLLSPLNKIIKYIFISLSIIVIFTIPFVIFISKKLLQSFVNLQNHMDNFAENHDDFHDIPITNELSVLENSFNQMATEINSLISEIELKKDKQALAELNALQSQINPHFLYNALGAISWKAKENRQYEIDDMIISLSTFFRIGLHKGDTMITVAEELEHLKSYLEIEMIRFPNLFDICYNVDPEITNQIIPKIILQPIVENSINHGFRNQNITNGFIQITFEKRENNLYFEVTDNGIGFQCESGKLPKSSSKTGGYGLYNVNERLIRYYGSSHQLQIESTPGIGTKTYGTIPIKT